MPTTRTLLLALASAAAISSASVTYAAPVTWDANGATAGQTNGGGAWLGANQWWDGATNVTWTSGDDATFGVGATNGGAVTLASPTTVGSITFNQFNGTYTLGSSGQAITLNNGIVKNAGSAAATVVSPIVLGGAQTWTNNSTGLLLTGNSTNLITNGGFDLTVDGTGTTTFGVINNPAATLAGSGNLIKNGSGRLNIGGDNTGFTGTVTINGGVVQVHNVNEPLGLGNLTLNGGVISWYWSANYTRTLGTGNSQVQVLGGESGFAGSGATGPTVNLGSSVTWGSTYFQPSKFVLGDAGTGNAGVITFSSDIDLNGATRTIVVPKGTSSGGNRSTISGAIGNSTGTAGLIKEGGGELILSTTNTFNGDVTINGGTLTFNTIGAWGGAGKNVTFTGDGAVKSAADGYSGGIVTVNSGVTGTILAPGAVTYNSVTGAGNLVVGSSANKVVNIGDASGLTGNLQARLTGNANYTTNTTIQFSDLSDEVGSKLEFVGGTSDSNQALNVVFSGGSAPLVFNDRQIAMLPRLTGNHSPRYAGIYNNNANAANTWVINTDLDWGFNTNGTPMTNKAFRLAGTNTGENAFNGLISQGASLDLLNLVKEGTGKWIIGHAANTYAGSTTISAGTLEIQGNIASSSSIANSASLIFNSGSAQSYANAISGTGTLTKTGLGTLTLSGTNGYTGATTITEGTLLINGSTAAGSAFTVASTATLGGTGTIAGTVGVSGTLSPGASIESLATGALTMNSGSTFVYEATDNSATGADVVVVSGALSLTNVILDLTGADLDANTWVAGDKLTLISYAGTGITGGFTGYTDDTEYFFGINGWTIDYNDTSEGNNFASETSGPNYVTLELTTIPEPGVLALVGLAGLMFIPARRKRPA